MASAAAPARILLAALLLASAGCAVDDAPIEAGSPEAPATEQRYPDVLEAELTMLGDGRYEISVTLSSAYDAPERYADGWRVLTADGTVLAEHSLAHHHADEQPFTRTRGPFEIPPDLATVTVEGRDLEHGYGGGTVTIDVPR